LETVSDALLPWYRPRARERPPKVPVCNAEFVWSAFDMQQTYLPDRGLWRLMMPIIVHKEKVAALGTFIECALSGDCFYGDCQKIDELKEKLFRDAITYFGGLSETTGSSNIPSVLYRMMTLEKKAGPQFKEWKIHQFSKWLSR
jgi:hypothetical protein